MRRYLALAGGLLLSLSSVNAWHHDKYDGTYESRLDRFVQRTPQPAHGLVKGPLVHDSMERAGYPQNVRVHSQPSVSQHDHSGYVGGRRLTHNNVVHGRGPGSATGPIHDGVYATDWTGFREHLGRVFLRPSVDPSKGRVWTRGYSAEGPRLVDIGTLRPFRKAVLEKREDAEKGHGEGHGGHGEGGHGEAGHGAEGHGAEGHGAEGAKKEKH